MLAIFLIFFQERNYRDPIGQRPHIQATMDYVRKLEPAGAYMGMPANAFTTKFVQTVINKVRRPVNALTWTPEGKRMITGSHSGEFTLWNGLQFNFETILQAHSGNLFFRDFFRNFFRVF
jgi:polyadenylation factor subunit 2